MQTGKLIALLLGLTGLLSCAAIGSDPDGERLQRIRQSRQYNIEKEAFENTKTLDLELGRPLYKILYDHIFNGKHRRPQTKLPEAPPALSVLENKSEAMRFIWLGHSTLLVDIEKIRILIDPIFSDRASPLPVFGLRFQPPAIRLEQIPSIDVVVISHDHYDHLDYETITALKKRKLKYFVPLGVGAHLEGWGISAADITELDWWQSARFKHLQISCTPAQHFSGRGLINRNSTLWASWAILGEQYRMFFSGDSGYSEHYQQIGEKLGPFDLSFLENGAYSIDWKHVHQLPEETVQASIDLRSALTVPVHWGMFDLSLHSWYEPIQRVTAEAKKRQVQLIAPKLGQLISIKQKTWLEDWWSELIPAE